MRSATAACVLAIIAAGALPARADTDTDGFEEIYAEDGITVYVRDVDGQKLPTFRGEGVLPGSILDVLAVFKDGARHTDWMHSCKESVIIKRISELEALVYNRTGAPWPISDRDAIVHAKLTYDVEKREAWNHFKTVETPLRPPVDGVVRMPLIDGFYHLLFIDPDHTAIVYQVTADPGGWIPTWLAKMATKRLPYRTIKALRDQVRKTRGSYAELIAAWVKKYDLPTDGF